MNLEDVKKKALMEHEIEICEKKAAHSKAIYENIIKIEQENAEKLDMGVPVVDLVIELKNKLWLMEKNQVDKDNPEYMALNSIVRYHDKHYAEDFYMSKGWHRKFSGEWVKKETEKR